MNKKIITLTFALLFSGFFTSSFAQTQKNKFVLIETTQGNIKVEIFADVRLHAENFLKLVSDKFYDSLLFHRVMPDLMIQGGDPNSKRADKTTVLGNGEIGKSIPAEINEKYYHRKGALVAAGDNSPEKSSSACRFYIVQGKTLMDAQLDAMENNRKIKFSDNARADYKDIGGTPQFDGSYTVFGQVVEGLDIVEKISLVPRTSSFRPKEDVRILHMKIVKN